MQLKLLIFLLKYWPRALWYFVDQTPKDGSVFKIMPMLGWENHSPRGEPRLGSTQILLFCSFSSFILIIVELLILCLFILSWNTLVVSLSVSWKPAAFPRLLGGSAGGAPEGFVRWGVPGTRLGSTSLFLVMRLRPSSHSDNSRAHLIAEKAHRVTEPAHSLSPHLLNGQLYPVGASP